MEFQDKEQCIGYFGFGNGYHLTGVKGTEGYCNTCPLAVQCWESHRARVRQLFPDLCKVIDEKAKELQGPALVKWIMHKYGSDPYLSVMVGNLEDAQLIKLGRTVKDRGECTLAYPFNVKN